MDIEKFTKYVEEINERIREKLKDDEEILQFYSRLVFCFNAICEQNKKQKEVIDNITNNIQNDIDGFITINDHGECSDILELLKIYLDILKEVSE